MPGVRVAKDDAGGANLMGADLYKALSNYFITHLKTVRQVCQGHARLLCADVRPTITEI
jgi:hypothetical protein